MRATFHIFASCLISAAVATPPQPLLKPEQIEYLKNVQVAAASASAQAEQEMLGMFRSIRFRLGLLWNGMGHNAWRMFFTPASELMAQLKSTLEFTEYTSNFGVDAEWRKEHPGQAQMDFDDFEKYGYIPNMWELRAAKSPGVAGTPPAQWGIMEAAETGLYRAPISGKMMPVGPNATEAIDRIQYLAGNLRRVDIGIARYGAFAAIIRNDVIRDRAALLPTDTGGWENGCNSSVKPVSWWYPILGKTVLRCNAMFKYSNTTAPIPGTTGNQLHTILSNSIGLGMDGGALSRLVYQMISPRATTRRFETLFYTEAGVLGTVRIQDIKLIVASFPGIFGTAQANRVRDFCTKHRIPLAWALNTGETWSASMKNKQEWLPFTPSSESVGADRLIDPITLSVTNATVKFPPLWKTIWKVVTAEIEAKRLSAEGIEVSDFEVWWNRITAFGGRLHTMRPGDCHSTDLCSGTYAPEVGSEAVERDAKRDCLCRDSDSDVHTSTAIEAVNQAEESRPTENAEAGINLNIAIV